ncbi:MAG: hypothetical protein M1827_001339 [Pycnora praestabilis]|nr:MAG: hypothetical protein M1827_001339 [Pycnora praestabilis]
MRPIIFIGHSLGGLVIKQAMVIAHLDSDFGLVRFTTTGMVFLGTPYVDPDITVFAEYISALKGADNSLLKTLRPGAPDFCNSERLLGSAQGDGCSLLS